MRVRVSTSRPIPASSRPLVMQPRIDALQATIGRLWHTP